ncbi:BAH_G0048770.mRNA.1.CDS.1 [Saccharomyces cerevisiae]|nr:SX2_G0032860.mRNA.1.CDS.1 [Saccharomyces cerevisiae]CAI4745358.1 BAH_G0048770.mRNA.1.CDS.1 [Saccharomyces cerevisiae]CAI4749061.1 BAG_1a_G0048770.mRNA.1.CDS.1 [Saccharomyces cerevisiae]CAI7313705.1 BAG_1a_G0048770.mRNA.1.CDS.1 [Saccharomyces cerevisiae]CAI7315671.1 BAH_G0048770.mRNA.1.CDS.1 [Saccharomyces cerevisiae]
MEEKEGIKDSSLLEKSNVPESINEDISKTTDVDLNSDGKKDNDTSAKDGAPKVEEKVNKSSGIDGDEVVTPAEDAKEEEEEHPPLPARRKSEEEPSKENPILQELKDAFPNLEEKYIKAVIIASQGVLSPAFNALLFLSDPESGKDIELPTQPVRKNPEAPARRRQTQLEQDELLARQLDEQFNSSHSRRRNRDRATRSMHEQRRRRHNPNEREQHHEDSEEEDSWSQFVEKDLPELTDRAGRSLQDTANKVSNWISDAYRRNFASGNEQNDNQHGHQDQQEWEPEIVDLSQGGKNSRPQQPERRRFNSFGVQVGDDSLESHGITLHNEDGFEDDEDVPPQLPTRTKSGESTGKVVAETTYIDTPDTETKKKWQPLPPEPLDTTPTKVNAVSRNKKNPDEDEFLINSDDEM